MTAPEDLRQSYQDLTLEVSGFHERLQFAREEGDLDEEIRLETEMNQSLEDLGDVIRALGTSALNG